jgi:phosphoglycerate kinase
MENLSVRDLEVKGRRVLVGEGFNVPTEEIDGNIRITDIWRESLSTIQLLRVKGAKVIALAHFGLLKGKPNLKYSLRPVADHLTKMIPPRASLRDSKLVTWAERVLRSTRSKLARLRPFSGTGPAGVF